MPYKHFREALNALNALLDRPDLDVEIRKGLVKVKEELLLAEEALVRLRVNALTAQEAIEQIVKELDIRREKETPKSPPQLEYIIKPS